MTCQSITSPPAATLARSDTVADAVAKLLSLKTPALPVVDAKGAFAGAFGLREVITMLLPRAARIGDDLGELAYVTESMGDLRQKLGALASDPVEKHMAPHRTVRPETSLVEALLLLNRGDAFLPVVDDAGKLVGIVTAGDALANIVGGQ